MRTHHLLQLVPNRVAAAVDRLRRQIWSRTMTLSVEATDPTSNHTTWPDATTRRRSSVTIGSVWGHLYDQRWCRIDLPLEGERVERGVHYLEWRDQAEATLYVRGVP